MSEVVSLTDNQHKLAMARQNELVDVPFTVLEAKRLHVDGHPLQTGIVREKARELRLCFGIAAPACHPRETFIVLFDPTPARNLIVHPVEMHAIRSDYYDALD